MKVLAITSALLVACSSAAAIASQSDSNKADEALKAREAEAAPLPGWWGFRYSGHGSSGWKRDADAAANPGWWGFRYSRHGSSGWKRDADAAPEPAPGFRYSGHGSSGLKRDVPAAAIDELDDDGYFIYLPKGMTPDDLAAMVKDAELEDAGADNAKTEET